MVAVALLLAVVQSAPAPLTDAQIEDFLLHARIVKTRTAGTGVTLSDRATLRSDALTHEAQIQRIDERRQQFATGRGVELNFRDSWMYNVAAYRLDRLIGLNLVPVSVARRHGIEKASFTWWVDDVAMDEGQRLKNTLTAPDVERWNQQVQLVRVFDQLIANTDRNLTNLLITTNWRVWAIDHTRAFRLNRQLKSPRNITRCDRQVLEKMKRLDRDTLRKQLGDVLTSDEIDALVARRDAIVRLLEAAGPSVLFDRLPS